MNLAATAPGWTVALLAALLIAAAVEDSARLRISNFTSLAVLLLGLVAIPFTGISWALWQNLLVFVAMLAVGTLMFGRGMLGGGDVKLFAALGLWYDLRGALLLITCVFIAGGVLAVSILAARYFASDTHKARVAVLRAGSGIPYGVAITVGAILTLAIYRL